MKTTKKQWEWIKAQYETTGSCRFRWKQLQNRYKNGKAKYRAVLFFNTKCSGGPLNWDATIEQRKAHKSGRRQTLPFNSAALFIIKSTR